MLSLEISQAKGPGILSVGLLLRATILKHPGRVLGSGYAALALIDLTC